MITYQVKVVLNDISLEGLQRQCSLTKSHDEWMMNKSLPDIFNLGSLKEILNEPSPYVILVLAPGGCHVSKTWRAQVQTLTGRMARPGWSESDLGVHFHFLA